MRSRRFAITGLAAAATIGLLAGCSGGSEPSEPAADGELPTGQTISVWTFGATGLEESMEAWAEETGNEIEIKTSEFDPHHEQLLTALATGAVPDVALVETAYSSVFKPSAEFFTDLREYGADDIEGDFLDWRWAQGVADDGTVIGLPTDVGGMALAYRTDLFEAAGLPSDTDGVEALWSSWEEFVEVGEEYTETTGEPFLDDAGVFFQTVYNQGDEKFYSADGSELIYDSNPQVQLAWDLATSAAGISANLAAFSPEWNTGMANGDYAVQLAPAWMLNYIQGQAPDTAGLWNVVTLPEGGGNWGGSQMTVPAEAANPALAYDMLATILSPENQLDVFKEFGNFPSTPGLYEDPALTEFTSPFFSDAPVGLIYTESVEALEPVYEGPKERAILREFGLGIDRVESGDESPDEAWQSTLDAVALEVQ
ncbi:ABC transporter substrate-binding protein [Agromyces rhizosphaerae]|uniref:ABC transporter substrate-binding protein n=1 Tax=Agromyces rhizosphaerae TaxID=88374 RepID=A0A9W6CWF0_9MICO|nr:extracellular solute-binding protein [Agromyces rhizosphaerae]GLI26930.1 ABC transporter substrate-binding protein [Agromyces rhizosphaerae]